LNSSLSEPIERIASKDREKNKQRMQCAQTAHLMMNSTNTTPRTAEAKIFQRKQIQIRA
jgi:hypothetical protein